MGTQATIIARVKSDAVLPEAPVLPAGSKLVARFKNGDIVAVAHDKHGVTVKMGSATAAVLSLVNSVASLAASAEQYRSQTQTLHDDTLLAKGEFDTDYSQFSLSLSGFNTTYGIFDTNYTAFVAAKGDFDTKYTDVATKHGEVVAGALVVASDKGITEGYRDESLQYRNDALAAADSLVSPIYHAGPWDASSGSAPPAPAGAGNPFYKITAAGVVNAVSYGTGDNIVWDGADWYKIDNTEQVSSVDSLTGDVDLSSRYAAKGDVLTAVPLGAVFTDTTYSVGDGGLSEINFTSTLKTELEGKAIFQHPTGASAQLIALDGAANTGLYYDAALNAVDFRLLGVTVARISLANGDISTIGELGGGGLI